MNECFLPRRILMSADTVGGVWTYALDLIAELGNWKIEVVLATMGKLPSSAQSAQAARILNLELCASEYRLEWMNDPWHEIDEAGAWLLELEQIWQPDMIHLNHYAHGALDWQSPVMVVGHSCVLSWYESVHGHRAPACWDRYRDVVRAGLQAADIVVAPTESMLRALGKHYGPFSCQQTIWNGRRETPVSMEPHGHEKDAFILSAGRMWDEAKNLGLLEAVAPELSWPVYVAGPLQHPDGGIQKGCDSIRMLGMLTSQELGAWYRRAPIYVMPARYEPFGLTILEAALAGCALIVGDIESLHEVWQDCALYVSVDNADMLAATIESLIVDKTRMEEMGRRARRRAAQFGTMRMAGRYVASYQNLLMEHAEQVGARGTVSSGSEQSP